MDLWEGGTFVTRDVRGLGLGFRAQGLKPGYGVLEVEGHWQLSF